MLTSKYFAIVANRRVCKEFCFFVTFWTINFHIYTFSSLASAHSQLFLMLPFPRNIAIMLFVIELSNSLMSL